jgi:hypothetical protein
VGLIAEDVAKIDQRLVTTDANGDLHSVRYLQITAVLIKAMQEQNIVIERQQIEIYGLVIWCLSLTGLTMRRCRK